MGQPGITGRAAQVGRRYHFPEAHVGKRAFFLLKAVLPEGQAVARRIERQAASCAGLLNSRKPLKASDGSPNAFGCQHTKRRAGDIVHRRGVCVLKKRPVIARRKVGKESYFILFQFWENR